MNPALVICIGLGVVGTAILLLSARRILRMPDSTEVKQKFMVEYDCTCPRCDAEFKVQQDIAGECPNCHTQYEWDFDGDYDEDSVYLPVFEDKP